MMANVTRLSDSALLSIHPLAARVFRNLSHRFAVAVDALATVVTAVGVFRIASAMAAGFMCASPAYLIICVVLPQRPNALIWAVESPAVAMR